MKWTRTKKLKDLQLEGVKVEIETVEDNLAEVKITDAKGKVIRLQRPNSYDTINAYIVAPPKMVKKWIVTGTIDEAEIKPKTFDNESEADNFISNRDSLKKEEKEVEVTED
jgi:hypothetical protein